MPTYEYECAGGCPNFDKRQLMSAKPLTKCPQCGSKVTRLVGAGGSLIFKGSGFPDNDAAQKQRSEPMKLKEGSRGRE